MSRTSAALEAAVATVIENTPLEGERATARQRANVDRAFAAILKLIAPRVRHFIRQYGLTAHWDDAEQCCAIGVHRAIQAYDPTKAQFTTFVNWQLRGELQSLRFRLMTDQRASAKKVEAKTVSLHAGATGPDGEEVSLEAMIEDENARELTESGASDYLAKQATEALIKAYVSHNRAVGLDKLHKRPAPKRAARTLTDTPAAQRSPSGRIDADEIERLDERLMRDREVLERRVFGDATLDEVGSDTGITKEQIRQICKRATKGLAGLATTHSRFAIMADYAESAAATRAAPTRKDVAAAATRPLAEASVGLLPDPAHRYNRKSSVVAIKGADRSASPEPVRSSGENFMVAPRRKFPVEASKAASGRYLSA